MSIKKEFESLLLTYETLLANPKLTKRDVMEAEEEAFRHFYAIIKSLVESVDKKSNFCIRCGVSRNEMKNPQLYAACNVYGTLYTRHKYTLTIKEWKLYYLNQLQNETDQ